MKLTEARSALKAWLSQLVRIDAWTANPPAQTPTVILGKLYPPNRGIQLPLSRLSVTRGTDGVLVEAVMPFGVEWRFSKALMFHQLPLSALEAIHADLGILALTHYECIAEDFRDLQVESTNQPVVVTRMAEGEDWLVQLSIGFRVRFLGDLSVLSNPSDIQPGEPGEPWQWTGLDVGIYRSLISQVAEPDASVLDRELHLPNPS